MPVADGGPSLRLPPEQVRVLGCLVEKELTTPQQYPLTLNALTLACNQSSNRDPVVSYDEATVELAVRTLKQQGLARFVHPSHGRSALRYAHLAREGLGVDGRRLALLAVLLLRGPQTVGELRSRTERMADFGELREVEHELDGLGQMAGGLVEPVPRQPGQKEGRYAHRLGDVATPPTIGPTSEPTGPARPTGPADGPTPPADGEVGELRREVGELRRLVEEVRRELGMDAPGG
jgi:uncharacterized protein YceH (UPF0502 family)